MSEKAGLAPATAAAIPAVREHLRGLVESPAFKGSRRGQQFLQHIVEKALAGQGDELKERSLGVALFGRDPSYDTGEDAIVRVTASDVRKRLHHFYSETRLKTSTARSLQLSAFKTDDDFISLGSPRSNPWGALFQDQLDFDFVRDPELDREVIRNKRAQPGELPRYVPTARGWDTGHAFAIIALVGNPNQAGKGLLLAGTNAEGTEAAGQFVANRAQFARTLQAHGIDPGGPPCHFEILLQVRTMAGSPSKLEVVACRRLPGGSPS